MVIFCYFYNMGEKINKEFEKFQEELKIKETRLKFPTKFTLSSNIDDMIEELKNKKITL